MSTLQINPWLYKSKGTADSAPIYYKLKLGTDETQLSSGLRVHPKTWDSNTGRVVGKFKGASDINKEIELDKQKLKRIFLELKEKKEEVSLRQLKEIYQGRDPSRKSLLEVVEYHNEMMRTEVGKTYSQRTYLQYTYLLDKIKHFLVVSKKPITISLKEVDHQFITEFTTYMKVKLNNKQNTVHKSLTSLKKIVNMSLDLEWIVKNPFRQIKMKKETPPRTYLTEQELERVEQYIPKTAHLQLIKDCSLMQIYTGAAYYDLRCLTTDNLIHGMDGEQWIVYFRQKTKKKASIPLLPIAQDIIQKYNQHPCRTKGKFLIPLISNQKMNKGIKELMKECKINKNISTHSYRRTFATTITVRNGVSLEAVRDMLGQTDIKTTQIYAVVEDVKISDEMKRVMQKLTALKKAANE